MRPALSRVGRFPDAIADRDVAAHERLTRPDVEDVVIGGRDRDRSDRRERQAVGERLPPRAAVGRLEEAARRRARVVDARFTGLSGDGDHAIAVRSDEPPAERFVQLRIETLCADTRGHSEREKRCDDETLNHVFPNEMSWSTREQRGRLRPRSWARQRPRARSSIARRRGRCTICR